MDNDITKKECTDPTQIMTIEFPCAMIERVQKLADEKNTTLSNILIEALDSFLRKQG
jgi:predicted transcriptional regulator